MQIFHIPRVFMFKTHKRCTDCAFRSLREDNENVSYISYISCNQIVAFCGKLSWNYGKKLTCSRLMDARAVNINKHPIHLWLTPSIIPFYNPIYYFLVAFPWMYLLKHEECKQDFCPNDYITLHRCTIFSNYFTKFIISMIIQILLNISFTFSTTTQGL